MNKLTVALPKGRMFDPSVEMLRKVDLVNRELDDDSRKLVLKDPQAPIEFILAKPVDVPTYVEHGVADIGISGKDILLEAEAKIAEVLDLKMSSCRLVVALPEEKGITSLAEVPPTTRVASKYVNVTKKFFNQQGIQVEVVKLNGSIELAPLIGLSDMIVDISSTGRTLRENNLIEIAEIAKSSARLVVNKVSYKSNYKLIKEVTGKLRELIG